MARLPSTRRGPALMVLAALCFTVMVALVKGAKDAMGPVDLIFWRCAVAVPVSWWIARSTGLVVHNRRLLALRCALGFGAMLGYFTAAQGLPITSLALISKLQPVLIAVIAPLALGSGERVGPAGRVAIAVGLLGSALIIGPELTLGSGFGAIALGATLSSAGAHSCLRGLGRTDDPDTLAFWFQLTVLLLSGAGLLLTTGISLPPLPLVPHVVGIGLVATAGQLLITRAYKADQAAVVAAAGYSSPVWAVLLDLAVFGDLPGPLAWVGGMLVVGAGLLLLRPVLPEADPLLER